MQFSPGRHPSGGSTAPRKSGTRRSYDSRVTPRQNVEQYVTSAMSNCAVRNTQWVCMCICEPSRTRCTLQCQMHVCSKQQQSLSCCTLDTSSSYGINCSTSDSRGYEEPVVRALWRSASRAVQEISQQVGLPRSCWDLSAESMPKCGTQKAKRPSRHTSRCRDEVWSLKLRQAASDWSKHAYTSARLGNLPSPPSNYFTLLWFG